MQTILVTGGAGFIGSCLVRQWVAQGDLRLVNLDLLTYAGSRTSLATVADSPLHTFVEGDIRDRELVARLLAEHRPTAMVHLAAESHVDRSIDGPQRFVETNVVGTFTLLDETRKYWRELPADQRERFRFVHVSTDEVYGALGDSGTFDELSPYQPNSPYAATKASSDHLVRAYHRTYGLPTITTNSSNNYGPYQYPEKLVPLVALNALDGRPIPVYGSGNQVRDWLHVADHAQALRKVLDQGTPGETYCIGGDCEHSNLEVVHAICDAVDQLNGTAGPNSCRKLIEFVADRPGHDWRYALDSSKVHEQLGWKPTTEFAVGIRKTVRWYAENRAWVDEITGGNDRRGRLGLDC
ncbi:dTDP-glucose 4,6-dehydratase [Aeoliella sp.]|uniref:dTDP-glucose 4,6-dehydratase n=1 Tax=Aeoliella sp. TaxID=2795800 RepID=UPI003CCBB68B